MRQESKSVFDGLLLRGIREGKIPAQSKLAREWFRTRASKVKINNRELMGESTRLENKVELGNMYFFVYDPKHKKDLPYYDTFPLIFPIGEAQGGFLGINFHYLPPMLRAKLMDALYTVSSDKNYDSKTKIILSYKILQQAAKFKYFKPCIKHYLTSHVKSSFIKINPVEWDIALFLPVADFQKASASKVYADSLRKVK